MKTSITLSPTRRFIVKAPTWEINACRSIPSRRYVSLRSEWIAPVTRLNSAHLLRVFPVSSCVWSDEALSAANESVSPRERVRDPFPHWYKYVQPPFDHQRTALDRAWSASSFAFFMEMGTGKTKTTIDLVCAKAMDGQIEAALIVAPLSMILGWRDEIKKQSPIKATISRLRSSKKATEWKIEEGVQLDSGFTFYLANIEGFSIGSLAKVAASATAGKRFAMVVDESTYIKNHETARTKSCIRIGQQAKARYILSGLPVLKGALDLYAQMQFLDPDIVGVGDFYCYRNRYAVMGGYENREVLGYQNLEELASLIAPHAFQITKKEALTLPDKVYKTVRVELTAPQLQQIKLLKSGLVGNRDQSRSVKNVLEKVLRIQQVSSGLSLALNADDRVIATPVADNPKMHALRDIMTGFDGKAIVWCSFVPEVHAVALLLDQLGISYVKHTGEDASIEHRQTAINEFQHGEPRVFIATVQSGGIAITLTAATLVVYISNSWSLQARAQSEDRAHRIGQTNKVTYIDLIADGSVDDLVRTALTEKRDLAEHIRLLINEGLPILGVD